MENSGDTSRQGYSNSGVLSTTIDSQRQCNNRSALLSRGSKSSIELPRWQSGNALNKSSSRADISRHSLQVEKRNAMKSNGQANAHWRQNNSTQGSITQAF